METFSDTCPLHSTLDVEGGIHKWRHKVGGKYFSDTVFSMSTKDLSYSLDGESSQGRGSEWAGEEALILPTTISKILT